MATLQIDEIVDAIVEGDDMDQKIKRTERAFSIYPPLKDILAMASDPALKMVNICDGFPEHYNPDNAIPAGIADTNVRTEFRRICNFLPGRSLGVLSPKKRVDHWRQMISSLHWKEAEIITMVKDQTLLNKYPDFWVILPAVGIDVLINTKETTETKKTSKKEKVK